MERTKPHQLIIAGQVMWALWAFGGLYAILGIAAAIAQSIFVPELILIYVLVLGLLGLLIRSVLAGRKWARLVYTILACVWILSLVLSLFEPQSSLLGNMLSVTLIIGYGGVLRLLFHPLTRPWFNSKLAEQPNNFLQATRETRAPEE
jgi:hypothetical protein